MKYLVVFIIIFLYFVIIFFFIFCEKISFWLENRFNVFYYLNGLDEVLWKGVSVVK